MDISTKQTLPWSMLIRGKRDGGRVTVMAQGKRLEADELLSDLIQLTALREAIEGDFYGSRIIADFANRGYIVSPGTIYPMLHVLERKGYLVSRRELGAIAGYTKRQKSVGAS